MEKLNKHFLRITFKDNSIGSLPDLLNLLKVLKFVTRRAGTHGDNQLILINTNLEVETSGEQSVI